MAAATAAGAYDLIDRLTSNLQTAYWIAQEGTKYLAEIRAYQDPPMTLDELAYGPADRTGYQLHHIVEQTPAEQDGFPRSQIDGDENLVYVPTLKHREISAWYQK